MSSLAMVVGSMSCTPIARTLSVLNAANMLERAEGPELFSTPTTFKPSSAAERNAATPATPSPITHTSHSLVSEIWLSSIWIPLSAEPSEVSSRASRSWAVWGAQPIRLAPAATAPAAAEKVKNSLREKSLLFFICFLLLGIELLHREAATHSVSPCSEETKRVKRMELNEGGFNTKSMQACNQGLCCNVHAFAKNAESSFVILNERD